MAAIKTPERGRAGRKPKPDGEKRECLAQAAFTRSEYKALMKFMRREDQPTVGGALRAAALRTLREDGIFDDKTDDDE